MSDDQQPPKSETQDRAAFIRAANNGDYTGVIRHLKKFGDAEVNAAINGETALMWAAYEGHASVVKLLLERGADIQLLDNFNCAARTWAEENEQTAIIELLDQWTASSLQRRQEQKEAARQKALYAEQIKSLETKVKIKFKLQKKPTPQQGQS